MLNVENLKTIFHVDQQVVHAVDGVSFEIKPGQIVGLVGESGSGKSVTSLSILNLLANNGKNTGGKVWWKGQDLLQLDEAKLRHIRGSDIGLIFQNPLASLNPVYTIGNQLVETIRQHQKADKKTAESIALDLLKKVKIADPVRRLKDYPHQCSLGMCQRIMIALTLAMSPELLIADEPTASLDVTIQAQILALLQELNKNLNMSILLISHDLGVIAQYCDHILIMYLGKIVEEGSPEAIFHNPLHPYTQALISSVPSPDPRQSMAPILLKGEIPSPLNVPSGCRFHPRCPKAMPHCKIKQPVLMPIKKSKVACYLYHDDSES